MAKNVSEIETGAEVFMRFVTVMMNLVREKAIPSEAIYWLTTLGGRNTLGKMLDVAYEDWRMRHTGHVEQLCCEDASFVAPVVYNQPKLEELKRQFPGRVNRCYEEGRFHPIKRCKGVSQENRKITFEYVYMGHDKLMSISRALAEMEARGLRPALYEESLSFAEQYPDEQHKYIIVALGSEMCVNGETYVASLTHDIAGRILSIVSGIGFYHYLAVREEPLEQAALKQAL